MRKKLKLLIYAIGFTSIAMGCWTGYQSNGFLANPIVPDAVGGKVIPFELKGRIFYISHSEQVNYYASFAGTVILMIIYVIAYKTFVRPKNIELKKSDLETT